MRRRSRSGENGDPLLREKRSGDAGADAATESTTTLRRRRDVSIGLNDAAATEKRKRPLRVSNQNSRKTGDINFDLPLVLVVAAVLCVLP